MRIYDFIGSKGYEIVHCVDKEGWEIFAELDGSSRAKTWKPVRVRRVRPSSREGFRPSDSPYRMSHVLIFRRSAVDTLRDILDAHGELLPLEDEGGVELFAYHPRALDALDHVQSKGWRNNEGKLDVVNTHVFFPEVIDGVDVFKQVAKRAGAIYLGERFIQRWKEAKLKGLDFILAWDSDLPPDKQPNVSTSKPIKL